MNCSSQLPISTLLLRVWKRNMKVWSKYIKEALIGTVADPLIFLFFLGYGMGQYIGAIDGISYIQYIAPGLWMSSAMHAACAECTYGAYTRLSTLKTYDAMLATPLNAYEIVAGDVLFAATRSFVNCCVILLIFALFGLIHTPLVLFIPVVGFFIGLFFAGAAMSLTAMARGYEFFVYFYSLIITPMFMLSGIFFPINKFPGWLEKISFWIPLTQVVDVSRSLFLGSFKAIFFVKLLYIVILALIFFTLAAHLIHKRLIK